MARIRTIKPEFWMDEVVGCLEPLARLMFIGCWNLADDEGLLRLNPAFLKAQLFPYDAISVEDSKNILGTILDGGLIFPYKDQKQQQYGWIVNFRKHQRIDKPQKAKHPLPSLQNPKVRQAYARRDDFICHICGVEILPQDNVQSTYLSVVHLKPRSNGGEDSPSNIKAAHFGCNASKGNRIDHSENILRMVKEDSKGEGKGKEGKGKEQGKESISPEPIDSRQKCDEKIFIELPLNAKNTFHNITEDYVLEMKQLYQAVIIEDEFRKMRGWLDANPAKRKTKTGICKFINSWLSRAQDSPVSPSPNHQTSGHELKKAI